jgi:hypothetical protein
MNRLDGDAVGPVKVLVSIPVYSRRCWPSPPEPILRASPSTMVPSGISLGIQIQHVREWRAQTAATKPQCEELSHGGSRQAKAQGIAPATLRHAPLPNSRIPPWVRLLSYMRVRRCRNDRKADGTMHRTSAERCEPTELFSTLSPSESQKERTND